MTIWSRAAGKRSTTGYAGILRTLVQDIETPAPDRLVIVTKEPTLVIPTSLSRSLSTEGMVLPKKYIEQNGDDAFARKPVGSGPYRFVEQITGSHIRLAAVDNHWRIGTPKYRNMIFRIVPEETTRIALLRRGEVDVTEISRERVAEIEAAVDERLDGLRARKAELDALMEEWARLSEEAEQAAHEAATRAALLDVTSYSIDLDLTTRPDDAAPQTFGSTTTIRFTCGSRPSIAWRRSATESTHFCAAGPFRIFTRPPPCSADIRLCPEP